MEKIYLRLTFKWQLAKVHDAPYCRENRSCYAWLDEENTLTDGRQSGDERHGDAEVDVSAQQQRPQVAVAASRAGPQREQAQLVQRVPPETQAGYSVGTLQGEDKHRVIQCRGANREGGGAEGSAATPDILLARFNFGEARCKINYTFLIYGFGPLAVIFLVWSALAINVVKSLFRQHSF